MKPIRARCRVLIVALASAACAPPVPPPAPSPAPAPPLEQENLEIGSVVEGFRVEALYVDDDDRVRGAHLTHARTGFVVDALRNESAPQALFHVTTYVSSDRGIPHVLEHLLVSSGTKGRLRGNQERVRLARSVAYTEQHRTVFGFSTPAKGDTFFQLFDEQIDMLLHPDFTDDESRAQTIRFNVARAPDGQRSLVEAGVVFNEVRRRDEEGRSVAVRAMKKLIYGEQDPLAVDPGGTPDGLRELTPAEVRAFHASTYRLANMTAIVSLPSTVPLSTELGRIGATLDRLWARAGSALPPPAPVTTGAPERVPHTPPAVNDGAPPGTARVLEYAYATASHPAFVLLAWPATRADDPDDRIALDAFFEAFAGGAGSNLHAALVDARTRSLDVGAADVGEAVSDERGEPVFLLVKAVAPEHADGASLRAIRSVVSARLRAVAALPDRSAELAVFDARVKARVLAAQRRTRDLLDGPPGLTEGDKGGNWIVHLEDVSRAAPRAGAHAGRLSLTRRAAYEHALALADAKQNAWRERIAAWGLLTEPYAISSRASPAARARLDAEAAARKSAELARLLAAEGVTDPQAALLRREAELTRAAEDLEREQGGLPMPPLTPDPPMALDDGIVYRTESVRGVPVVASTFETMRGVTFGIRLRLDVVPEADLPIAALLPDLLTEIGVRREGAAVSADEVRDRLRVEVRSVNAGFSASLSHDRAELAITASGSDLEEARRALGWLGAFLSSPDLEPRNLPRIREVVRKSRLALDETLSQPPHTWVADLAGAYHRQDHPALAHAESFLTRAHDAFRLSWMLAGDDSQVAKRVAAFLSRLRSAGAVVDRGGLVALASELSESDRGAGSTKTPGAAPLPRALARYVTDAGALDPAARELVRGAARDLAALLPGLPEGSVGADWAALCEEMAHDVVTTPPSTLAAIDRTLALVRHASGARAFVVGSSKNLDALRPDVDHLLAALDPAPAPRVRYAPTSRVFERARERGEVGGPSVVGFVTPSASDATIATLAPSADYDSKGDALVDALAASVFAGGGAQGLGARMEQGGLAYGGGLLWDPGSALLTLFSQRIPDAARLVRTLSGWVRGEKADPRYVDYAVVSAFWSRLADPYERRASAIAADVADGVTPERVRAFRQRVLDLRGSPGLAEAMQRRFVPVVGQVLPTLAGKTPLPPGAVHFAVGPEKLLAAYEQELRAAGGADVHLTRLYPRDFW